MPSGRVASFTSMYSPWRGEWSSACFAAASEGGSCSPAFLAFAAAALPWAAVRMRADGLVAAAAKPWTANSNDIVAIVKAAYTDLWPAVEAGKLSLPIGRTFPLDEVADALAHMQANAHFGKIVLVV